MTDPRELRLHVGCRCHVAVVKAPEVELHPALVAPLERQLIDGHRGPFAAGQLRILG